MIICVADDGVMEDEDVDAALWSEVTVGGVRPKHAMKSGETVQVQSATSDTKHTIKRVFDHYYCTCYAWRQQKAAVDSRTCRHLKEYLGDAYEAARVGGGGSGT
jgi:DNA ligase-1